MKEAELAAQFEKQVRALYPDGEMPATEGDLLLELASAQGLSREAAEGVLKRCRPKAKEAAPAPEKPRVARTKSAPKKSPAAKATSAPEAVPEVVETSGPVELSAAELPLLAQPIPVFDAPPPLLEKRRERAVEHLAEAKNAWVFRCVVIPMGVLVLIGVAVVAVSTWWNGSDGEIEETGGVGTSAEAPTGPENEPEHAAPRAVFRDVFPTGLSLKTVVFELPEAPTAVVDVPRTLQAFLRVRPLLRMPAGQEPEKEPEEIRGRPDVLVEGRAPGASGWLPLLDVQLRAGSQRVVCTADPNAAALLPGFGDHFVPEVTGARRDVVYRCRRRTGTTEVLETLVAEFEGKVTFGTVRVSYPWPGTLTVRAKGESAARGVQPGVQRWTRGNADPVVVEAHLTVDGADVGLSLRSPELEARCRAAALAKAELRKAEAALGRLPPEAGVSHNPLERKRYEAQRYRQAVTTDEKERRDATEELKRVREQLARVNLEPKQRMSLRASEANLQRRLDTLEINLRRNAVLLSRAEREIVKLE